MLAGERAVQVTNLCRLLRYSRLLSSCLLATESSNNYGASCDLCKSHCEGLRCFETGRLRRETVRSTDTFQLPASLYTPRIEGTAFQWRRRAWSWPTNPPAGVQRRYSCSAKLLPSRQNRRPDCSSVASRAPVAGASGEFRAKGPRLGLWKGRCGRMCSSSAVVRTLRRCLRQTRASCCTAATAHSCALEKEEAYLPAA